MSIAYGGLSPGAQVTRGFWRVTLAGGFDIQDLFSPLNEFQSWDHKIANWRARVASAAFPVPAQCSPAATSGPLTTVTPESRAVVDVWILGADAGLSVSALAGIMNGIEPRVDVLAVQAIASLNDDTGRGKAIQDAEADAHKESLFQQVQRWAEKLGLLLLIGAGAILLLYLLIVRRQIKP